MHSGRLAPHLTMWPGGLFFSIFSFFFPEGEVSIFAIWSKFARLKSQTYSQSPRDFSSQENWIYASANQLMVILTPKVSFQCQEHSIFVIWSKFARLRASTYSCTTGRTPDRSVVWEETPHDVSCTPSGKPLTWLPM